MACGQRGATSTWTFAEDPVVGHEMQGHWGNPRSSLKRTPHAMPNGFRSSVMLWRLVLRVDDENDESISLRVAARQENGRIAPWAWVNDLPVQITLRTSLHSEPLLSHEVLLSHAAPVASVTLQCRRSSILPTVAVATSKRRWALQAYARLGPEQDCRYGLLFPLPYMLREASTLKLTAEYPALPLPIAAPSPELDDIEAHQSDQTGTDVWDPGIVLACALPQLLPGSEQKEVLELGAGLGLVGFVAALLGHRCTSTDLEAIHASSSEKFAAESVELLKCAGCCWQRKVLDWSEPPDWALERTWDTLLGADLLWYAVGHDIAPGPRSWADRLQTPLLRLLSRLRFGELLLAERERDLQATEEFFQALDLFGFEARRLDVPLCESGALTDAVDVAIWSIRHACLLTVPPAIWSRDDVTNEDSLFTFPIAGHETVRACQSLQSDELGAVVWDAAVLLSWFLCQFPWVCQTARILELGAGTGLVGLVAAALGAKGGLLSDLPVLVPLLEKSISSNTWIKDVAAACLDWEDPTSVKDIKDIFEPQLLLLAADVIHERVPYLALLDTLRHICELRSPKATRLLLAHQDRQPEHSDRFFEASLRQGFSVRIVARHPNEKTCLAIYMLNWNEPDVHVASFQGKVSVCVTFPGSWLQNTMDCDVQLCPTELQFSWDRFGWRRRARLPFPVDVEAAPCILRRRQQQLIIELRRSKEG